MIESYWTLPVSKIMISPINNLNCDGEICAAKGGMGITMNEYSIKDNIEEVKNNIAAACQEAGRAPEEVTLIAVSKTKPVELLRKHMIAAAGTLARTKYRSCLTNTR